MMAHDAREKERQIALEQALFTAFDKHSNIAELNEFIAMLIRRKAHGPLCLRVEAAAIAVLNHKINSIEV
jgi:hypothetical protein